MKELEKIDVIRDRTGVSYEQAVEALRRSNGNVLEAIVNLEQEEKSSTEEFEVYSHQIMDKVKKIIKQGNVTRIRIKKNDKILLNIPVTAGIIGTALYPPLTIAGVMTALATKCTIEIERDKEKNIIDKNDKV